MQKSMLSVHVFCLAIVVAITVIAIIIMNYVQNIWVHICKKYSDNNKNAGMGKGKREDIAEIYKGFIAYQAKV